MKIDRAALLVLLFTTSLACATTPRFTVDAKRTAELWKQFESWLTAYEAHDLDKVMGFIDKDVLFSFQGVSSPVARLDSPWLGIVDWRDALMAD